MSSQQSWITHNVDLHLFNFIINNNCLQSSIIKMNIDYLTDNNEWVQIIALEKSIINIQTDDRLFMASLTWF